MGKDLTFDDVSLEPQYSNLVSRESVDISTNLGWEYLTIPVISSPMSTITGMKMQEAMLDSGGIGVHHRYNVSEETLLKASVLGPIAVAPSMGTNFLDKLSYLNLCAQVFLDIAHGDSEHAHKYAKYAIKRGLTVISGNIVTPEAAKKYIDIGVTTIQLGLGSGSLCTTRLVAGVGVPQLQAILDIRKKYPNIKIISDGGIRTSGDIVKALAAGADAVIVGRLLAGTRECPVNPKITLNYPKYGSFLKQVYSGMASKEALTNAGKTVRVEGITTYVKYQGTVKAVLDELSQGIRTGLSYLGCENISELRNRAKFRRITDASNREGYARS